jgi:hypothetical protein
MQIYALDQKPNAAVKAHCDSHLRKVAILEASQIICDVLRKKGIDCPVNLKIQGSQIPSKWALENNNNFLWLIDYFAGAIDEYDWRNQYNKNNKYKNQRRLYKWICDYLLYKIGGNPFNANFHSLQSFGKYQLDKSDDPVKNYRLYYTWVLCERMKPTPTWTRREPPEWLQWRCYNKFGFPIEYQVGKWVLQRSQDKNEETKT